ncbi:MULTISPECIES: thioredoxin domain-containing protein [unclassified Nocardia]|uniref:DsbA family protein n=1 Tax=unclassified Nocardia TaxID=2637762 RepID=UPI001CE43C7E|nr:MULTISPECIES: thioredoxin domain-containing protein [unclassified Nocardia]
MSSKTTYALGGVALALVVLIVILAFRWGHDEPSIRNDGYGPVRDQNVHSAVQQDGVILLGKDGAAKTIDLYEDPLCPACGSLERIHGQEIAQQIDEGKLAVRYHLLNFLDQRSGSKNYSTRAIAANQCVAQAGSGPVYSKFHELLFTDKQPKEGGNDLSNDELAAVARVAGAPESVVQCIGGGSRIDAAKADANAGMDSLHAAIGKDAGTPTVLDGGKKVDWRNSEWVVSLTK